MKDASANLFLMKKAGAQWRFVQDWFLQQRPPHLSLVFDATRMAGKDTLYTAVFDPRAQVAAWLPPQAGCVGYRLKLVATQVWSMSGNRNCRTPPAAITENNPTAISANP
eukprot:3887940-Lingulodinium_polyedra.AAC.1